MNNIEKAILIKQLKESGKNVSEISRYIGSSLSVVRYWLNNEPVNKNNINDEIFNKFIYELEFNKLFNYEYYYLLGQYFGDGYINKNKRTYRLRISTSECHQNIKKEVIKSLITIFPNNKIQYIKKQGCLEIGVYNSLLHMFFPHLGVGVKHNRNIILSNWQLQYINHDALLRGLIHSDGTSYYRTQNGKKYLNYGFNNCSIDIVNILIKCLEINDINYKIYNKTLDSKNKHVQKVVTICKRPDVEKLHKICGIKS